MQRALYGVVFLVGAFMGGNGVNGYQQWIARHDAPPVMQWLYRSMDSAGDNVVIDLKTGETNLGPHYDRTTEAKKLFEMMMQMYRQGQIPECHETGYQPPESGMRRINPGPADPAPPITEQQL